MKKFLAFTVVLFLLAIVGLLAAPSFIDWNKYRPQLQALVESRTGCRLDIRDNVKFSLFPHPQLTLVELELKPKKATDAEAPFSARWLQADLSFRTLLQGDFEIERLHLVEPSLNLERWQDCWPDQETSSSAPTPASETAASGGSDFLVQKITLSDGQLSGTNALVQTDLLIPIPSATLSYDSKRGQYHLIGEGRLADQITRFDITYNDQNGAAPWGRVKMSLPEISANASISFRQDQSGWLGKLEAEATHPRQLSRLQAHLPLARSLSEISRPSFPISITGSYLYGENSLSLDELDIRNGPISIQGAYNHPLTGNDPADGHFKIKFLDLDRAASTVEQGNENTERTSQEETVPAGSAPPTVDDIGSTLPDFLSQWRRPLALELSIDQIQYRKALIRQAYLRFSNDENGIILDSARALLPGGSDISLIGTIDRHDQGMELIGDLSFQSDDLRRFLRWTGIEPTGLSENRLRSLRLASQITAGSNGFGLHGLDARLDSTHITGSVQQQIGQDVDQIEGQLRIDRLNLDAYGNGDTLPRILTWLQSGFRLAAPTSSDENQQAPAASVANQQDGETSKPTHWKTDLEIDQLTSNGLPMKGLSVTIAQRVSGLLLERFQLDDLRGLSLQASGRLPSLDNNQKASLAVSYYLPNPERTAARFGSSPHIRRLMGKLGGGSGSLLLEGDLDRLALRLHFDGVSGRVLLDTNAYLTQIPQRIQITDGQIKLPDFETKDLRGDLSLLADGSFTWNDLSSRWQNLEIRSTGSARPETGGIDLTGKASLTGEDLGQLGSVTGGYLIMSGPLQADLSLNASKLNLDRPLDRLTASGTIQGGLQLTPGPELDANSRIRQVANLRRFIEQGFQGRQSPLSGQVSLKGGILSLEDVVISGKKASARLNARLNSANARLNAELSLTDSSGDEPVFSLKASGPIDRPNLKATGSWLKAN